MFQQGLSSTSHLVQAILDDLDRGMARLIVVFLSADMLLVAMSNGFIAAMVADMIASSSPEITLVDFPSSPSMAFTASRWSFTLSSICRQLFHRVGTSWVSFFIGTPRVACIAFSLSVAFVLWWN